MNKNRIYFLKALAKNKEMPIAEESSEMLPKETPISKEQAANALKRAWEKSFGTPPTLKQISILIAQWAIETGWGSKMIQYNFGNLKGTGPTGLSASYTTTEGYGSAKEKGSKKFRAYDNIEDGAQDYLDLLITKYPKATQNLKNENVDGFVDELSGVYFTGDPKRYKSNMKSIVNSLTKDADKKISSASKTRIQLFKKLINDAD